MMLGGDSGGEVALACDGAEVLATEGRSAGGTLSLQIDDDHCKLTLADACRQRPSKPSIAGEHPAEAAWRVVAEWISSVPLGLAVLRESRQEKMRRIPHRFRSADVSCWQTKETYNRKTVPKRTKISARRRPSRSSSCTAVARTKMRPCWKLRQLLLQWHVARW